MDKLAAGITSIPGITTSQGTGKSNMMTRCGKLAGAALIVVAVLAATGTSTLAQKKNKKLDKMQLTPLMTAASNCKLDDVSKLLSQGADIKARDAAGRDALTWASAQRDKYLELKCPDVVTALVKAGADPEAARFYQSPEFAQHKPSKIALLRVEDTVTNRKNEEKAMKDLEHGLESALSQGRLRAATFGYAGGIEVKPIYPLHYPITTLAETREKLQAAGFSEAELNHPDRKRACSILGADAVLEVAVKSYGHGDIGVMVGREGGLEYRLTDCGTGQLLWRNDPNAVEEDQGFIVRVINGMTMICEIGLTLPPHVYPKKLPKGD